jgi:hypothetical protein
VLPYIFRLAMVFVGDIMRQNLADREELADALALIRREEEQYRVRLQMLQREDAPQPHEIAEIEGRNPRVIPEQRGRIRTLIGEHQLEDELFFATRRANSRPDLVRRDVDALRNLHVQRREEYQVYRHESQQRIQQLRRAAKRRLNHMFPPQQHYEQPRPPQQPPRQHYEQPLPQQREQLPRQAPHVRLPLRIEDLGFCWNGQPNITPVLEKSNVE